MAAIYTISFLIVSNSGILPAQPLDSSEREQLLDELGRESAHDAYESYESRARSPLLKDATRVHVDGRLSDGRASPRQLMEREISKMRDMMVKYTLAGRASRRSSIGTAGQFIFAGLRPYRDSGILVSQQVFSPCPMMQPGEELISSRLRFDATARRPASLFNARDRHRSSRSCVCLRETST